MEIEDSLFSMDIDDLDVVWMVSDRVMKSWWRTMKSPGWVMKSGVFRYVCIFCMSNCKNIVSFDMCAYYVMSNSQIRISFIFELIDFYYFCILSCFRDGRCSCRWSASHLLVLEHDCNFVCSQCWWLEAGQSDIAIVFFARYSIAGVDGVRVHV